MNWYVETELFHGIGEWDILHKGFMMKFSFEDGFESIDEACKKYGYDHSLITRCCQHKVSIAYGYEWEYAFDYFIELTKQLRHNQRRYFAQRRPEILATCKKLESEVDAIVAKITDKQMRLF